ncbi:PREDICTED: crocetin glucosyltransferase, chloroplastic-like [Nelumbo nucifera]|uniref:Glycosyltransferase n=2 Tax=Nelumbo nucifera TaxID=4432 RepID=A0A822XWJ4_NELNU|nr:PREDICTED: crocetin glucosyltransferase, chloroplastic-like [Nelumbo nucifera]DAD24123.1 TPA_asm: hypothetical protein HUJ06_025586 [Nelumbo nucifera]
MESHCHFLLVTFPAQGHINPALQFAKRLTLTGVQVTFVTSVSAFRLMTNLPTQDALTYFPFSDGYDDGCKSSDDFDNFMSELRCRGSQALTDYVESSAKERRPVTCLIYTILLPWAAEVASNLGVPSALLWIQPAAVLDIYYFYFNGYGDLMANFKNDPLYAIELPGLPLLTGRDVPSFFLPSSAFTSTVLSLFEELLHKLFEREPKPRVLVNTFDALEREALGAVDKLNMVGIGPLIPSAFLDGKDPSDKSFGGDLFNCSADYIKWLNTKPEGSVVYVSFGTVANLQQQQMKEIARGLLDSRRPFLWVIRTPLMSSEAKEIGTEAIMDNIEELKREGMIVSWCSQVEVLCHPSVGCFLTHCGWNSTLEGIVAGVPMVGFPQWSDQGTNAKLIEDVWKTGVRLRVKEGGEGGDLVDAEEIKRCLCMVMEGETGKEMRKNAKNWRDLSLEAVKEGGSTDKNLRAFLEEIRGGDYSVL